MDYPFHSDGCSVVPDYDQTECCVRHDWLYWKGGGFKDRLVADEEFFECVKETQSGWLAPFRWLGVRIGGVHVLPFRKWRWGYGWKWPRYKASVSDDSPYSVENQKATYEQLLEKAREQDRQRKQV